MSVVMPAEWAPQDWIWIGFPHLAEEWSGAISEAQEQIAAFANAVALTGDRVRLVVRDLANEIRASGLCDPLVELYRANYGDIWLRDTGPLIVSENGRRLARLFRFNGWGGKYRMPGDNEIGALLAQSVPVPSTRANWILEGGAIDGDGAGNCVTTEQCLLNRNRNPDMSRRDIARALSAELGMNHVLWLGEGLVNDHTDGHVDNLARFVAPNVIALPEASGSDDPNREIYKNALDRARYWSVDVVTIPSPGRVEINGEVQPASHMNFTITNQTVIVPLYGTKYGDAALKAIEGLFPTRKVIGLPADKILMGGGSFHCASQQLPDLSG